MILSLVNEWFQEIAEEFNQRKEVTHKLRHVSVLSANVPASQLHLGYRTSITRIEKDFSLEAPQFWNVSAQIDLKINVVAKNFEEFRVLFDTYLWVIDIVAPHDTAILIMYTSGNGVTYTEDFTLGGASGRHLLNSASLNNYPNSDDYSNGQFPLRTAGVWAGKSILLYPDASAIASGSSPVSNGATWDAGIPPLLASASNNQSPVRRSGAWAYEQTPREYFAYIFWNGSTAVLQDADGNVGFNRFVINTIGSNPTSVVRTAAGDFSIIWASSVFPNPKRIVIVSMGVGDEFGSEISGQTTFNHAFSSSNTLNIVVRRIDDTDTGTRYEHSNMIIPVYARVYA